LTKNFSGAEIAGLVRSATSFALNSHVDVISADSVKPMDVENIKVTRIHFMRALEEVTPAFGVQEDVLKNYVRHGIISYSPDFTKCYDIGMRMVKQVQSSEKTPLISMLFEGTSGNGITALAAHIGMASNFPFVKMISPEDMIGFSESAKCQKIAKVFSDAYKSPLSLVILDNIERLLEYVRLGPRFSNPVLQTLLVLVKRIPPNEHSRIVIIGTTNDPHLLSDLVIREAFNVSVRVPEVKGAEALKNVFKHERVKISDTDLETICKSMDFGIGIKKYLANPLRGERASFCQRGKKTLLSLTLVRHCGVT